MDTTGFSQVGRYGTISLMKRHEPETIVTSFGIDSEELTFGRDPTCSVRLYYPDVSLTHCKIVFEERKAFLVVLGANGLLVDGCQVYPSQSSPGSSTTIPLPNNSEFEIHGKRFRFSYPSKELRSVLFSTPPRPQNRALRLSMIQSAQVFSPRPSHDPRENLRILQSPLKNTFKSPVKPSLLSRPPVNHTLEEEDEEEDIVLVDGDHPRVVEEERDLVILEDVEVAPPPVQVHHPQPRTPKRSLSRNTLHRAVLIRSAQRAVWKAEKEREEEEEELEVLAHAVAAEDESEDEEAEQEERYDEDDELTEEEDESEEDGEEEEYEEGLKGDGEQKKSMWRKSLERIWPFRSSSPTKEEQDAQDVQGAHSGSESESESEEMHKQPADEPIDVDQDEGDENIEQPAPLRSMPLQTPIRRPLGSFMTPQPPERVFPTLSKDQLRSAGPARRSLAGEAQRVMVQQPWRVKDIVVPLNLKKPAGDGASGFSKQMEREQTPQSSPVRNGGRPTLTEEEKKAIQERRRSALREVDTYFAGGVPGMTPSKPSSSSLYRRSISPTKPSMRADENPFRSSSPVKARAGSAEEDEELDTRSLLDKMKETVEGMKRRRSMVPSAGSRSGEATPRSSVHATPRGSTEVTSHALFSSVTSPAIADAPVGACEKEERENGDTQIQDDEKENPTTEEPFSLLRPGAREEIFTRCQSVTTLAVPEQTVDIRVEESDAMVVDEAPPAIVVEPAADDTAPAFATDGIPEKQARGRGRARLLRATKSPAPPAEEVIEESQEDTTRLKASTRRTPRLRTPQPEAVAKPTSRLRTPQPDAVNEPVSGGEPDELADAKEEPTLAIPKSAPRRGRKATVEPEETLAAPLTRSGRKATEEPDEPAPAPARRGRKVMVKPEEAQPVVEGETEKVPARRGRKAAASKDKEGASETVTPMLAPAKRGRKAAATLASEPARRTEEPTIPQKGPTPKSVPVRKGRGTRTMPIEVEDVEDDPLDSIGEIEAPAPAAKPKARRKAIIKQEEPDEIADIGEEAPAPVPTRGGRSKSVAKSVAKAAPAKTPATKVRAEKKTPATAPAAIEVDEVDKENTPGSGSGSNKSSPVDNEERGGAVKVRVSRTRATKATVKEEEEPVRGRTTRTRTRTKAT